MTVGSELLLDLEIGNQNGTLSGFSGGKIGLALKCQFMKRERTGPYCDV